MPDLRGQEEHLLHSCLNTKSTINMEDPYKEPAATLKQRKPFSIFYINSIFITCVVFFILIIVLIQQNTVHDNTRPPSCQHPTTRQEWRRLSPTEKQNYIDAVRCLETVPSRLYPNRSIYDDFPWTHIHNSNSSHGTAAFLAWHRYFIHVYETALRERCKYTGTLTYWDWTLDWKDMTRSPVWDTELGFGGNGNLSTEPSVGVGHCVTDGPFANLQVLFYGLDENRHCLSRHFRNGQDFHHLCSYPIRLEAIQTLLRAENYESFNLELEDGAHHAIPNCIRGDWLRLTVPYGTYPPALRSMHWLIFRS